MNDMEINIYSQATTKIGMREFLRNTKAVKARVAAGETFEVLERTTPVFKIVPVTVPSKKKYTREDLRSLQFTSKTKDVSRNIDHYVYGMSKK